MCEEQERRSERGSGIGKRYEEGGTNRETAIRKGDVEREREREGWKNGREGNTGKCSGSFCPCGAEKLFLLWKNLFFSSSFFPVSRCILHVFAFLPLPVSVPSSPFISLHVLPFSPSICLPLNLSDPISTRLSMASALCFSPPIVFNLCSPRMHLFKSCFTKTVLKQIENVIMMRWTSGFSFT